MFALIFTILAQHVSVLIFGNWLFKPMGRRKLNKIAEISLVKYQSLVTKAMN